VNTTLDSFGIPAQGSSMKITIALAVLALALPSSARASPLDDALAAYYANLRAATPGATEPERADCHARAVAASGDFSRQGDVELACLQAAVAHHKKRRPG
jgi:hypothetical protein